MAETLLDLSGLKCPLPALKTRRALSRLEPGESLVVTCTDPMSAIDIPHLLQETGDILDRQDSRDAVLVFHIRKKPAA